jgi:hypothetical protein
MRTFDPDIFAVGNLYEEGCFFIRGQISRRRILRRKGLMKSEIFVVLKEHLADVLKSNPDVLFIIQTYMQTASYEIGIRGESSINSSFSLYKFIKHVQLVIYEGFYILFN